MIKLEVDNTREYRAWLRLYKRTTGLDATHRERTEAFFAAREGTRPSWAIGG